MKSLIVYEKTESGYMMNIQTKNSISCSCLIVLLSIVFPAISSCKKYEEDTDLIHLRTVKKRIEGYKALTKCQLGPTDLMPYWRSRFGDDFYLHLTLDQYIHNKKGSGFKVTVYGSKTICPGQWGFMGSERIFIHFDCLDSDTSTSFPNYLDEIGGPIVRLSNDEIVIKGEHWWHPGLDGTLPGEIRLNSINP